jgi:hypothetical protein
VSEPRLYNRIKVADAVLDARPACKRIELRDAVLEPRLCGNRVKLRHAQRKEASSRMRRINMSTECLGMRRDTECLTTTRRRNAECMRMRITNSTGCLWMKIFNKSTTGCLRMRGVFWICHACSYTQQEELKKADSEDDRNHKEKKAAREEELL